MSSRSPSASLSRRNRVTSRCRPAQPLGLEAELEDPAVAGLACGVASHTSPKPPSPSLRSSRQLGRLRDLLARAPAASRGSSRRRPPGAPSRSPGAALSGRELGLADLEHLHRLLDALEEVGAVGQPAQRGASLAGPPTAARRARSKAARVEQGLAHRGRATSGGPPPAWPAPRPRAAWRRGPRPRPGSRAGTPRRGGCRPGPRAAMPVVDAEPGQGRGGRRGRRRTASMGRSKSSRKPSVLSISRPAERARRSRARRSWRPKSCEGALVAEPLDQRVLSTRSLTSRVLRTAPAGRGQAQMGCSPAQGWARGRRFARRLAPVDAARPRPLSSRYRKRLRRERRSRHEASRSSRCGPCRGSRCSRMAMAGHWEELHPSTHPTARLGHSMVTVGGEVLLFGGVDQDYAPLGDLWRWDRAGQTWVLLQSSGPGGRATTTARPRSTAACWWPSAPARATRSTTCGCTTRRRAAGSRSWHPPGAARLPRHDRLAGRRPGLRRRGIRPERQHPHRRLGARLRRRQDHRHGLGHRPRGPPGPPLRRRRRGGPGRPADGHLRLAVHQGRAGGHHLRLRLRQRLVAAGAPLRRPGPGAGPARGGHLAAQRQGQRLGRHRDHPRGRDHREGGRRDLGSALRHGRQHLVVGAEMPLALSSQAAAALPPQVSGGAVQALMFGGQDLANSRIDRTFLFTSGIVPDTGATVYVPASAHVYRGQHLLADRPRAPQPGDDGGHRHDRHARCATGEPEPGHRPGGGAGRPEHAARRRAVRVRGDERHGGAAGRVRRGRPPGHQSDLQPDRERHLRPVHPRPGRRARRLGSARRPG